jgi:hypothetical protein
MKYPLLHADVLIRTYKLDESFAQGTGEPARSTPSIQRLEQCQLGSDDRRGRLPDESAHSLAVRVQNARGVGRRVDLPAPPEQRVVTTRTDQLSARYFDCLYNDASDPDRGERSAHEAKVGWEKDMAEY